MKKICFFIGDLNLYGGTERVTTDISNTLIKEGYDVTILNLSQGDSPFFKLEKKINKASLFSQKVSFSKNYIKTVKKLRAFIKKNDIEVLIGVDSILAAFSIPALVGLKTKHIVWEHFNFNIDLGKKIRRLVRQLSGVFADTVVVLTKEDKALWEKKLLYKGAKIINIPNPCTFPTNETHTPNIKNKVFLSVGRLAYEKGYDLLLQAWKIAVSNMEVGWKLLIVGGGKELEQLEKQIKDYGIEKSVSILQHTDKIEKHYNASSFYCLSSRFEGFGLVLLEAQSFGIPVVSFGCACGPKEIISDGVNGFIVPPLDIKEMASSLQKCSSMSEEEYQKMCIASKKNSKNFSIKKIITNWNDLLNEC